MALVFFLRQWDFQIDRRYTDRKIEHSDEREWNEWLLQTHRVARYYGIELLDKIWSFGNISRFKWRYVAANIRELAFVIARLNMVFPFQLIRLPLFVLAKNVSKMLNTESTTTRKKNEVDSKLHIVNERKSFKRCVALQFVRIPLILIWFGQVCAVFLMLIFWKLHFKWSLTKDQFGWMLAYNLHISITVHYSGTDPNMRRNAYRW